LIQTAVGFYHLSNDNYKGSCSQFGKALTKLEQYTPQFHGMNTAELVARVRACSAEVARLRDGGGERFDASLIPQIELS
jgi:predicted metal-dependent hydrolase